MKTVTIKLRIHKLLAEKRLTKYRFIAMTGLGYKMPAGFWTMKLNPSASAPSPASAPHWTVRPGDLFEVHEEEDPYDGMY